MLNLFYFNTPQLTYIIYRCGVLYCIRVLFINIDSYLNAVFILNLSIIRKIDIRLNKLIKLLFNSLDKYYVINYHILPYPHGINILFLHICTLCCYYFWSYCY